jgi:tRNA dimethylallyltransferase
VLEEIAARDPDAAAEIDDRNRRRLVRALEILRTTGGTLAEHQEFGAPIYDALQIGIDVPREALYARIDQRVDEMIGYGLVDEVRKLLEQYGPESQAMTGIGYRQIADFFAKKESLRDAVKRIKYDTHHYAKRQETWFRRDPCILWVATIDEAEHAAEHFLYS